MSKSKSKSKTTFTGETLRDAVQGAMQNCIDTLSATEKGAPTAAQWVRLQRTVTLAQCERIAQCDAFTGETLQGAVNALFDSERSIPAPVYGAVKLWDTLSAVATGRAHAMSDLHCAYIMGLLQGNSENSALNAYIARVTHKSASTAVTQRSSSAYALRSLGAVEDTGRAQYPVTESPVWGALQGLLQG